MVCVLCDRVQEVIGGSALLRKNVSIVVFVTAQHVSQDVFTTGRHFRLIFLAWEKTVKYGLHGVLSHLPLGQQIQLLFNRLGFLTDQGQCFMCGIESLLSIDGVPDSELCRGLTLQCDVQRILTDHASTSHPVGMAHAAIMRSGKQEVHIDLVSRGSDVDTDVQVSQAPHLFTFSEDSGGFVVGPILRSE